MGEAGKVVVFTQSLLDQRSFSSGCELIVGGLMDYYAKNRPMSQSHGHRTWTEAEPSELGQPVKKPGTERMVEPPWTPGQQHWEAQPRHKDSPKKHQRPLTHIRGKTFHG